MGAVGAVWGPHVLYQSHLEVKRHGEGRVAVYVARKWSQHLQQGVVKALRCFEGLKPRAFQW